MHHPTFRALLVLACLSGSGVAAQDSGDECSGSTACKIDTGFYHVALPETVEGAPVVLWLHGHNGRAERAARPKGMAKTFTKRGFVFVAPQGRPDPERPERRDWNVQDGQDQPRDDLAFLTAVLDDVAARFGTDPDRILLTGFSRGASMAWDFACAAPEQISALAVAAGGFWEPMTPSCAGPVNLFHTHGFNDRTVPLEGRQVSWGGQRFHQGNILKGLDVWREINGCTGAADINIVEGSNWEKRWTTCQAGSLRMRITPGGHGIPKGWSSSVLDWFDEISLTPG